MTDKIIQITNTMIELGNNNKEEQTLGLSESGRVYILLPQKDWQLYADSPDLPKEKELLEQE